MYRPDSNSISRRISRCRHGAARALAYETGDSNRPLPSRQPALPGSQRGHARGELRAPKSRIGLPGACFSRWLLSSFSLAFVVGGQPVWAGVPRAKNNAVVLEDRTPTVAATLDGIAEREMFRQALLIAAHDGMGLTIRDSALGEAEESHGLPGARNLNLELTLSPGGNSVKLVLQGDVKGRLPTYWSGIVKGIRTDGIVRVAALARALEPLSRGGFIIALKKAGFAGHGPTGTGAKLSPQIKAELHTMNFIAQFAVVRSVDAAIQSHGPSPEALSALARAYANLGRLTDHLWTAYRDVFKARAILYAYRLAALYPHAACVDWTKAYVDMLIGLPMHAVRQVARAEKGHPTGLKVPVWAPWVKKFAEYDPIGLHHASRTAGPYSQLANVLAAASVESQYNLALQHGIARSAMANAQPDCFFLIELLETDPNIGVGHQITYLADKVLVQSLCLRLPGVPGVPASFTNALENVPLQPSAIQSLRTIIHRLRSAGKLGVDQGNPSLQALAAVTKSTALLNCERCLEFLRFRWDVGLPDVRNYLSQIKPLFHTSHFWPLLEAFGINVTSPERQRTLASILQSTRLRNETIGISRLTDIFGSALSLRVRQQWKQLVEEAKQNQSVLTDEVDEIVRMNLSPSNDRAPVDDPYDPYTTAWALVWQHPGKAASFFLNHHVLSGDPALTGELGYWYYRQNQRADALKWLTRFNHIDPRELWSMTDLAGIYRREHDGRMYVATMRKMISAQHDAVAAADIASKLADYLMDHGHYRQAKALVVSGAQTWAALPMLAAARVYEHLGDFSDSGKWARRAAQRYGGYTAFQWYFWCMRTGRGDSETARRLVVSNLNQVERGATWAYPAFIQMTGRPETAMRDWAACSQSSRGVPWALLHSAAIAASLKNSALRDQYLRNAVAASGEPGSGRLGKAFGKLARLIQTAISKHSRLDLAAVRRLENRSHRLWSPSMCYIVGSMEQSRGNLKAAQRQYLHCIKHYTTYSLDRTLATIALRKMGVHFNPETGAVRKPSK